jgi:hypothetical protein
MTFFFWAAVLLSGSAFAQSIYGEIRGTVFDPSGAVIAGAAVTATRASTGELRRTTSDAAGNYALVNLEADTYEVKIEHGGFKTTVTQNVALRAREVVRVDTTLQLAQAATEILVTESRQVIATEQATIVDTKTSREIQALPVNFRAGTTNSVFNALSIAAGVQPNLSGSEVSLGGNMPFMATSSVDGISTTNVRSNGILAEMFPSADAIDEIKVSTTSNNAEFAQVGDVTTTSKGGSNRYHGTLFWYHQNGVMDARDFFSTSTRGAPFKISNDYGATIGGPIKKNKAFFFGSWEGLRYRAQNQLNSTVPPDAYRGGDLSGLAAIRDPLTGQDFPGNRIPAARISPVSTKILERLLPRQNQPGTSIAAPNLRVLKAAGNDNEQFDVRGDYVFNEQQNVFARYSWKDVTRLIPLSNIMLGEERNYEEVRSWTVAYNYVIRPNLVNEFRFGYGNRPRGVDFGPNGQPFPGPALVQELGIQGLRPDPPKVASVPDVGITGYSGAAHSRGFTQLSRTVQYTNNLTWTKGRHTIKMGLDLRKLRTTDNVSFFAGDDLGEYRFDGTFSRNPLADFLLGYPNQTRFANTGPDIDGGTFHQGYFIQDDWKVTPRLTMNVGVRYEFHPPFQDSTLQLANFDRDTPGGRVVVPNEASLALTAPGFRASIGSTPIVTAQTAGWPEALRYSDKNNFGPRFGFAWRPWGNKTVIRGGYGIYSVTILGAVFYSLVGIHTSDTRTFPGIGPGSTPLLSFPRPFLSGIGTVATPGNADFRRGNELRAPDPYAQQWNLTLERDLGWNTGLRLTYSGSHTLKLFASPDLNQVRPNTVGYTTARATRPFPNWAIVYSRDTGVGAKFNSLTTEVNKRFSHGLFFQSSWVWAKNLSNATGSNSTGFAAENGAVPTDRFNRDLDWGNVAPTRRHRWLTAFSYDLPFGRARKFTLGGNPVANLILGGWQFSGIMLWQSGPFLTPVTTGTDPSGTNLSSRASNRPDYTGTSYGNLSSGRSIRRYFDSSAFVRAANNIGRFGYVGPGQLVGPGTVNFSSKLQKRFAITERSHLQLEGSFANLFNHANFGLPGLNITQASFGVISSTQISAQGAEGGSSRIVQVGLRVVF